MSTMPAPSPNPASSPPPPAPPLHLSAYGVVFGTMVCKMKDIPRDSLDYMSTCVPLCVCVWGGGGGRVRYVCSGNTDIVSLPLYWNLLTAF